MTFSDLITQFSRYLRRIGDVDVTQMCGLADGTNSCTLKTTSSVVYQMYNNQYTLSAADNQTVTACSAQVISSFCYYLVCVNTSGSISIAKGTDNTYGLPDALAGTVPIGALKVTTDASHTFTCGTTDWAATGITTLFYDIDCGVASEMINQALKNIERGVTVVRAGTERLLSDWDHMKVRCLVSLSQGDSTVTIPFPGYKDFISLTITDSVGVVTSITKADLVPLGITVEARPVSISRLPQVETTFTTDGAPAMVFTLWPTCDQSYTLDVIAYQYSPKLDGVIYTNNWLSANNPDTLLFGALVAASAYIPEDARMSMWRERYDQALWSLYASQLREESAGDYLKTKFGDPLKMQSNKGIETNAAGIYGYGFIQFDQ